MRLTYDNVLVTGGAGFIGSHTVDAILANGLEVWVLDNLSSGYVRNLSKWRKHPKLHFEKGDITQYKAVDRLVRRVEAIVHLAAVVSPTISMRKPELTNAVNVSGTLNLLRAGLRNGVQRIVFASSSSVYGKSKNTPISEDNPLDPITPYGASKLDAEKYCQAYYKAYGLETISLRYFNVYGERQRSNPYSGVIAIFARNLLRGKRPVIHGDGKQTRDFIHVSDVVNANLLALQSKKGIGEAFNIGTGRSTSIRQLSHLMASLLRSDTEPVFEKPRPGDILHSLARITNARTMLGFQPRIDLRMGLLGLLKSFQP